LQDGYKWRKEEKENLTAYFVSRLMSIHMKKGVTVKELLKPLRGKVKQHKGDDE